MFIEYPKVMYRTDEPQLHYSEGMEPVTVNSEEEEAEFVKTLPKAGKKSPKEVTE